MYIGRRYPIRDAITWTSTYILQFTVIATLPVLLYQVLGWHWLALPWLPIAMIGTAVAFVIGFKNNASYERLWEARKGWGAITNLSRTWASSVLAYVTDQFTTEPTPASVLSEHHRRLIYRHLAWLTALRYQLRQPQPWENLVNVKADQRYSKRVSIVENETSLEDALKPFIPDIERHQILAKANPASFLLHLQAQDLKALRQQSFIEDFRHIELQQLLAALIDAQGQSERIKTFPFPRQYATMNALYVWLFIPLIPFGMIGEFAQYSTTMGPGYVWLTVPFTVLVAWVFHTMERIGESSENPFEGGPNDVPITAISRSIEIELRQWLEEKTTPLALEPVNCILS